MLQSERASSAASFSSSTTRSNERDVKPSEAVVDNDAGKRWTATLQCQGLAKVTTMPTGVGFGTSSAERERPPR